MIENRRGKKAKLIRELEEHPLVSRACSKLKISRATYYRWRDQDPSFKNSLEAAQQRGRDKFNDFAESKLIENMNANLHAAIVFWLTHNSTIYHPKFARPYAEENDRLKRENQIVKQAIDEMVAAIGEERFAKFIREQQRRYDIYPE